MKRLSIAILLLLVAASLAAQPAPNAQAARGVVLAKYLELTPDQVAAWKQIRTDTAAALRPIGEQARDLRTQLETAMTAATPDATTVGKLTLSLHALRGEAKTIREASRTKLRDVLTAEQKTKFDAFEAAAKALRPRPGR